MDNHHHGMMEMLEPIHLMPREKTGSMTRNLSRETLAKLAERASQDRRVSVTSRNQLRVSFT